MNIKIISRINIKLLLKNYDTNSFSIIKDMKIVKPNGKLSIIATPIGNLSDLTPNILKALFKADLIGCEDRRVAGQLYTLIKNKNIIQNIQQKFGTIGISNLVLRQNQQQKANEDDQTEQKHRMYEYANMNDKQRRKFLAKLTLEQQKEFKIQFLKYRAKKIINKTEQFLYQSKSEKFDDLYGIEISDYKHIQSQIMKTRAKKGRGLLIPLNTYSQTKMFDLVKNMLQSKHIAIVSDAGMPCISDPGWKIVRMIRESMPNLPIEVIGGPSAIDIMLTLAKSTTNSNSMSGRFQGFASPEISNITQENIAYNKNIQLAKQKDFSIHFINSKKLKKNAYVLQRIYGENHRIIVANQLTKKYERKFNGSLKQLTEHISKDERQFEGIGEMSYLLYSNKQNKQIDNNKTTENNIVSNEQKRVQQNEEVQRLASINVNDFIKSLSDIPLKSKQKAELVSNVFGVKHNQAKNLVYSNTHIKKVKQA